MKNDAKNLFSQADFDAFDDLLEQMEALVAKKLPVLSPKERSDIGAINEQNKLFVNKTRDLHQSEPSKSSPDVDWVEFEEDYKVRHFMETRGERMGNIAYGMQSAKIVHDRDNYQDSLNNYSYAQYKEKIGVSGFAEIVAQLKQFFTRNRKSVVINEDDEPET